MNTKRSREPDTGIAEAPARPPVRGPLMAAMAVVAVFFGGFGGWAATAPLGSAALAPAKVVVDGDRKTVQHLEGGIVRELLVNEGDPVKAGDLLIRLDETQARTTLELLRARHDNLVAREARLLATRDGEDDIAFPVFLTDRASEDSVATVMKGERAIFLASRQYITGRERILRQRVIQLQKEIDSLWAQANAEATQLKLVREEMQAIESLFAKGMVDKPRLLAAKRAEARIEGSRGEHLGLIARAEQRIGEAELEILDLKNRLLSEVVNELKETQANLADLAQRLKAAQDVLQRTEIRAPTDGIVVGQSVSTVRAVVSGGQRLLDIVPTNEILELEARIDPNDIDVVHPGLLAQINLTAFKQRTTPTLEARVRQVSADSFTDEHTGASYYTARLTIDRDQLARLDGLELYPGMPAEVMVNTGKQTFLRYLMAPLTHSLQRAFLEQ